LEEAKFTAFGLRVKEALLRRGKSQAWLEREVAKRTGRYMDSGLMYKILTGRRKAEKTVEAICRILGLDPEYHTGGPIKRTDGEA